MRRQMSTLMCCAVLFFVLGCASEAKRGAHEPLPHSHYYPFTQVMGDYHLRLVVDHADGEMALVFEDIAERPVKPVELDRIEGKVTFPDGTVKDETFRPRTIPGKRYFRHRYGSVSRRRGIYTALGDWIKTAPRFSLDVVVPFKGEDHKLTFQYEAPGGEVPYHRRP